MNSEVQKNVKEFIEKLVTSLGFESCTVEMSTNEEDEKQHVQISVQGEGLELLIGYHGKNLNSLHQIVSTYLKRQIGDDEKKVSLFIDVGGYYEKQNDKIREIAAQAVEEVKLLDEPYEFEPMSARLRRVVHMEVSKHEGIRTESTGEGSLRRVIIYPAGNDTTPKAE